MWVGEKECERIIEDSWKNDADGNDMGEVMTMISNCSHKLTVWNRVSFGKVQYQLRKANQKLQYLQENGSTYGDREAHLLARVEVQTWLEREETMWRQRSKALWLKEGDQNSKYFHTKASHRRRRNGIKRLKDANGEWQEGERKDRIILEYFQNLFSATDKRGQTDFLECLDGRVTTLMNEDLTRPYTGKEVTDALKEMNPSKAPGPDGMAPIFFQKYWGILKKILPNVISDSQSAFVPRRLITDNVLVAYELIHYLRHKTTEKQGYMSLKLDMSKTYDCVEWCFLETIMVVLGFEKKFVDMVMKCVTTVSFFVLINGKPKGPIVPSRGLRQGDPISPYLFLLCTEGLTTLLRKAERNQVLKGIKVCRRAPNVNHLLFVDDSVIFCQVNVEENITIQRILNTYEKASGQKINKEKTTLVFSNNVTDAVKEEIM
ncbi:hypothetical protein F2P56_022343 [Juglans regia]|uniref:Reverse transcriptase domain-containing protein n=2 Tax=Juglans regia TaxID=51240 RepID=A0A833UQQ7_JUGRE|nr:uncharacterized protein LOC109011659 [Juglans regia]KAF5458308.1 hypothetical protein F2P56_022343 [Juglans regia]